MKDRAKGVMERVNVTKTYLPPIKEYQNYISKIWDSRQLTNQGPLLKQFEAETKQRLGVDSFHFVTNGTIALQIALRALDISAGEVITTPFSYVATTSSILWERCKPVFVDIEPDTFCIDATKIEAAITKNTKAIMAVHVFGHPCEVKQIGAIAEKHKLKVIYDGAHAFGVTYYGKSLLSYGDISTCSFHATKLFHTIEGGCVIAKDKKVNENIELMKRFGHTGDDHYMLGINAKASEFQAAMGLCNLRRIDDIISQRKELVNLYDTLLNGQIRRPKLGRSTKYNHAYYPVVFKDEARLLKTLKTLELENIFPRRYFYPSLNTLSYLEDKQSCPVSENISTSILCLPLYVGLEKAAIDKICTIVRDCNG